MCKIPTQKVLVSICLSEYTPSSGTHSQSAKKKAKQLEKEAKLAAKALKNAVTPAASTKKVKAEKEKKEEEAPFVNDTPPGQKKGALLPIRSMSEGY